MSKQIEAISLEQAVKLALKALENTYALREDVIDAKEALREALSEQPEPLPVKTYSGGKAWHVAPEPDQQAAAVMPCGAVVSNVYEAYEAGKKAQPQPAREPLTDEQIDLLINGRGEEGDDDYIEPTGDGFGLTDADLVRLVRRVEAAHGINAKGNT